MPQLRTHRLELVAADVELAQAALDDRARFAALLDASVPSRWPPMLPAGYEQAMAERLKDPELVGWLGWYVLRVKRQRLLLGMCWLSGLPDASGRVFLSYSMVGGDDHRGYAAEAVGTIIDWVFADPRTRAISAETTVEEVNTVRLLERNGLSLMEPGPAPGRLRFELAR